MSVRFRFVCFLWASPVHLICCVLSLGTSFQENYNTPGYRTPEVRQSPVRHANYERNPGLKSPVGKGFSGGVFQRCGETTLESSELPPSMMNPPSNVICHFLNLAQGSRPPNGVGKERFEMIFHTFP